MATSSLAGISGGMVVAAVVGLYGLVVAARKRRFRLLSDRLHATYIHTGLFAAGKILGENFSVEARPAHAARGRRYRTYVQVAVPEVLGTYILRTDFFSNYPDWQFARTAGVSHERAFGFPISVPGFVAPAPDQRRILSHCLKGCNAAAVYETMRSLRLREVRIEGGRAVVSLPGAVSSLHRIQSALKGLDALVKLSAA